MPKTNSGRSGAGGSRTLSNPKTATRGKAGGGRPDQPSRAHRDDTPEARRQARGTPKTHPNQETRPGRRKDK